MFRIPAVIAWCLCCSWCLDLPAAPPTAEQEAKEEEAFQQAAAIVSPSVVKIETVGGLDRVSGQLIASGPTTGLIIGSDGWIISSAFNFIARPEQVLITLADGRRLAARQVASDRSRMLTLLKVDEASLPVPAGASRDSVRVGRWAIALGKTLDGDFPSVSVGIVSALNRIYGKALQTDAKISPINYGGPLINVQGEVMGLLVPLSAQGNSDAVAGVEWYDSGIGFAIPFADVLASAEKLKGGEDLLPGLLGVAFTSQDDLSNELVLDRVRYGSPAQVAGLKSGDRLLEWNGQPLQRIAHFRQQLGPRYAGEKFTLKAKRGDSEFQAEITLVGELIPYEFPYLGILPQRVTGNKPLEKGTQIRQVIPDSPAQKAGLKPETTIVKVNDAEISDSSNLANVLSRFRPQDSVTLTVLDDAGKVTEVTVKLGADSEKVPATVDPTFIAPPADAKPAEGEEKRATGLITEKFPDSDYQYWAYVPQDYNPDAQYGLMIWLHPSGNTHESAVLQAWKAQCEERGIILLAPKARLPFGWTPNDASFIKDLTEFMLKRYSIDRRRVALHSMGQSGNLAYSLAFQERSLFRGILSVNTVLRLPPPDNEPDYRLRVYMTAADQSPQAKAVEAAALALRKQKFPVTLKRLKVENETYPAATDVAEFIRWFDSLDRL